MDDFDILPDTRGQHDTIHSKEDIQECYILKKTGSQDDQEPRYEALKFHFHCTDSRHPQPCYRKQGQVNELGSDVNKYKDYITETTEKYED